MKKHLIKVKVKHASPLHVYLAQDCHVKNFIHSFINSQVPKHAQYIIALKLEAKVMFTIFWQHFNSFQSLSTSLSQSPNISNGFICLDFFSCLLPILIFPTLQILLLTNFTTSKVLRERCFLVRVPCVEHLFHKNILNNSKNDKSYFMFIFQNHIYTVREVWTYSELPGSQQTTKWITRHPI